jgi:hypothetical protein
MGATEMRDDNLSFFNYIAEGSKTYNVFNQ